MTYEKINLQFLSAVSAPGPLQVPAPLSSAAPVELRFQALQAFHTARSPDDINRAAQHYLMIRAIDTKSRGNRLEPLMDYAMAIKDAATKAAAHPADARLAQDVYEFALTQMVKSEAALSRIPQAKLYRFFADFADCVTGSKMHARMLKQAYHMIDADPRVAALLNDPQSHDPRMRQVLLQGIHQGFMTGIGVEPVRVDSMLNEPAAGVTTQLMRLNFPGRSHFFLMNTLLHMSAHLTQMRAGNALHKGSDPARTGRSLLAEINRDERMMTYAASMYVANILFPGELQGGHPAVKSDAMEIEAFNLGNRVSEYIAYAPDRRQRARETAEKILADEASRVYTRGNLTAMVQDELRASGRAP